MEKIPDILKKIVETKKEEVKDLQKFSNFHQNEIKNIKSPLNFKNALRLKPGYRSAIAEVKKASPSAGIISTDFKPVSIAKEYEIGDADAISVLTDKQYFKGDVNFLKEIKKNVNIPILRKDFIIDEVQIFETRAIGADSFLLIAAILSSSQLLDYIAMGRELGMEPLVEVHDEYELEKTLECGANIIGINNRNLRNFTVDIHTTVRLIPYISADKIAVGESGITSIEIAHKLYDAGATSLLIGEFLMRSNNKKQVIQQLKK